MYRYGRAGHNLCTFCVDVNDMQVVWEFGIVWHSAM